MLTRIGPRALGFLALGALALAPPGASALTTPGVSTPSVAPLPGLGVPSVTVPSVTVEPSTLVPALRPGSGTTSAPAPAASVPSRKPTGHLSTPATSTHSPASSPKTAQSSAPSAATPTRAISPAAGTSVAAGRSRRSHRAAARHTGSGATRAHRTAAAPAARPTSSAAPTKTRPRTLTRVIRGVTRAAIWALAALGLLTLLMAVRSAYLTRAARGLRRHGAKLEADVGALQSALLPAVPETIAGVAISTAFRSAGGPAAGGDFFDVLPLGHERIGVIVGRAERRGAEALEITGIVHYTVRAYLEAGVPPREALRLADHAIGTKLGGGHAAVLTAVYDARHDTLEYATAGDVVPVITQEEDAVRELLPPAIGRGPGTGYRQTRVSVASGRRICFSTAVLAARTEPDGPTTADWLRTAMEDDPSADAGALLDALAVDGDAAAVVLEPATASGQGTVIEEIDFVAARGVPTRLAEFLAAVGVESYPAAVAMAEVEGLVGSGVSARMRVTRTEMGTTWTVDDELWAAPPPSEGLRDRAAAGPSL